VEKCKNRQIIQSLPEGNDTDAGTRDTSLSKGRRQRIAIVRALVRNTHKLLLEEVTSAHDCESEAALQEFIDKASKGRDSLVIARRLIMVCHAGRIVEAGSHTISSMVGVGGPISRSRRRAWTKSSSQS
jgi:ABC-type multidrug transport system fused ATPase/permease subunit